MKSAQTELSDAKDDVDYLCRENNVQKQRLAQEVKNNKLCVIGLQDLLKEKDKLIKVLRNHINKMVTNRNCFDDSYSYPADLFDHQLPIHSPEMSDGKDKKKLKKERQRQKREHEALSRESSAMTSTSIDSASHETVPDSSNTPYEEVDESNSDWKETVPDSTNTPCEEGGEFNNVLLLDSLAYLLGDTLEMAMRGRTTNIQRIHLTITEMLRTCIQLPPEQSIEDSPEVCEMSNK